MAKAKRPTRRRPEAGQFDTSPPSVPTQVSPPARNSREAKPLSRDLVERVLLGGDSSGIRFTQDGPLLPDVWVAFASNPLRRIPVLITPFHEVPAARVARELLGSFADPTEDRLEVDRTTRRTPSVDTAARVAYLDQLVAANLTYQELLTIVFPLTNWWVTQARIASTRNRAEWGAKVLIRCAIGKVFDDPDAPWPPIDLPDSLCRFVTLAGLMEVAKEFDDLEEKLNHASTRRMLIDRMVDTLFASGFLRELLEGNKGFEHGSIYSISLNRTALPAITRSIRAVKADAATLLFKADCSRLTWAIIDSGIDGRHPTFLEPIDPRYPDAHRRSRVRAIYDFTRVRDLLWFDRLTSKVRRGEVIDEVMTASRLPRSQVESHIRHIAADVAASRRVNWQSLEELLRREPDTPPFTDHGTHVASILAGAGWPGRPDLVGMCPTMRLYDLRVLGKSLEETEFAVIAALQFIRQLNDRGVKVIHGANLSLSIPHDVSNYACGRTPVSEEAERLVDNTVTVVAAAGNFGYHEYQTKKGLVPGYCASSITDPGNAERVITVGATHRFRPHTYGVSYFSSRGPTGDGRLKPDLVAPGEKIEAALPGEDYGVKDGTSMAAPHVSGAAALLMARHSELTDNPGAIKRLLKENATDLGRERYFQGSGMLDLLRAMQKP